MIRFFIKHPTAANLLMIAFLVSGILSLGGLRRETFPDFKPREVEIRVPYPGATAMEVEEAICQRIEDAIDGVRFVEEIRSQARQNMGIVTVEMIQGGDYIAFKDEIDTEIAAIDDFPERSEEPVIKELNTTDPVLSLLVAGPMSPADLKLYAEDLKDRLQALPEVSLIEIDGFSDHQLRIELSKQALLRYNLSPADVAQVVSRQSVDLPAGTVEAQDEEVLIRFDEERTAADPLKDLVVLATESGSEIRIRDLGIVVDDFEIEEDKVTLNGQRAALLRIQKVKTEDSIIVANAVKEFLRAERKRQPSVELVITRDTSRLVKDRLGMLTTNAWQGVILVFGVLWLFFNTKLSLWVVASLPVSFLGAFAVIPHLGITINMLTMVGLLLAIGLLMDDGIVIAENVAAHRERGKSPQQAAIDGVAEVAPGVFSSFLTTACVLGPLAFLSGKIGRVLEVVPLILLVVLIVSLIEAFLILPAHLAHSLHETSSKQNRIRQRVEQGLEVLRSRCLGPWVDTLVRWRYLWLGCVAGLFLGTLALPAGGILKFQALPELEGDTVVARVLMPPGTPLERTEAVVHQLTEALGQVNRDPENAQLRQPGGKDLVDDVYVKFNQNVDAFETGPHVATVFVDLLEAEKRNPDMRLDDLFEAWRTATGPIPDALAVSYTEPTLGPAGRNIEVRIRGDNLDELKTVALELKAWLSRYPGVTNLTEDLRQGKREFRVRFRPGVLGLELDAARMASQLRAAFQGEEAAEIQVGEESYEIEVRFDRASQDAIADFEQFRFTLPDGEMVPLSTVAEVEEAYGWSRIARVDRQRTVTLRGDVDTRKTNTEAILTELRAELQNTYPELDYELEGETAEGAKTRDSMVQGMLVGVIGVFLLLSFQFRSYTEPLVVMAAIPLAFIGVLWGHLLLGYEMSMPSILGFVSLAGIVVNDSILLVLFLKAARQRGDDIERAASQASRARFRAILMTSATTIAGLLPLLSETSLQAQILIPLAISIVSGLLSSTVLVLLVVPCLYAVLHDFGLASKGKTPDESDEESNYT